MTQQQQTDRLPKAPGDNPPAAPASSPAAVTDIRSAIDIVHGLTGLMSQETRLLQAMQIKEFAKLQDRKASLVEAYENQTRALREDPGFAATIDPRMRAELKDVAERMQAVMAENDIAIKAARKLNERVATAIVDAVQSSMPNSAVYSSRGGYQETKSSVPVSVQIDGHF